ncbi:MAG: hypothetical protein AAFR81_28395 [Chloroflexota bacterium]
MHFNQSVNFQQFGHSLFSVERDNHLTFEACAQTVCKRIYNSVKDENGESAFALVRIFRSSTHQELPPEQNETNTNGRWLSLMGTYGDEPAWCDRLQSQGHRVLPAGAFETPMLSAAFRQIDLDIDAYVKGIDLKPDFIKETDEHYKYFHVIDAVGSPYIVVQDEFVRRYGIRSAVGFGLVLMSGAFYMCLAFSKITITKEMAEAYVRLSPYVSTVLASYEKRGVLWEK